MPKIVTLQIMVDEGTYMNGTAFDAKEFVNEIMMDHAKSVGGPIMDHRIVGEPQPVPKTSNNVRGNEFALRSPKVLPKLARENTGFDFGQSVHGGQELSDRDIVGASTVIVQPGVNESCQMDSFQNASIQGAGDRHVFSVATLLQVPKEVSAKGEEAITKHITDTLDRAATVVDGLQFQVAFGLSADHEDEDEPGTPAP